MDAEVLVREYRGEWEDCVHLGHICGVDETGIVRFAAGNPEYVAFLRSSGKPFQAIPAIRHGADAAFGLTDEEAAIFMGSHRGEPSHVRVLESIMRKTGIAEDRLICHPTYPLSPVAAERLVREGQPKRPVYHNCSGKHLGVLALCKARGYPLDGYAEPEHRVQREIMETLSALSETPVSDIRLGTDGCGFPVYALPLRALAIAYLKLACPDLIADPLLRRAVETIVGRMNRHPGMIAGTDRICSSLLEDPNIVAKGGAKGVYCFGLKKERLAFALKVLDGSEDEWPLIVASILEQIGYDRPETIGRMYHLTPREMLNDNRRVVGSNRTTFLLREANANRLLSRCNQHDT